MAPHALHDQPDLRFCLHSVVHCTLQLVLRAALEGEPAISHY